MLLHRAILLAANVILNERSIDFDGKPQLEHQDRIQWREKRHNKISCIMI